MSDIDETPHLRPDEIARVRRADLHAYAALYAAAGPSLGTGLLAIDGGLAVWNPRDEDPGFNVLLGFEHVGDPDAAWNRAEAAARAGGARVFGVGVTDERRAWATPERLAALGLAFDNDEIVWARGLEAPAADDPAPPAGIEIQTQDIDPWLFAQTLNRGWEVAEHHGRGHLYAATIGHPGWTHYLARVDGAPAGNAALCVREGVGVCAVAATDPDFRGRGVQTALIARRLADAAAAGCDLAVLETVAANASPRNARRAGFAVVHHRRLYAKTL